MAKVITMPRLSDTMTEGTVAKWLKKVGDVVKEGDMLAEIETDKATMEFETFTSGTLLYIGVNEGETASVDALLAIIGNQEEDISDLIKPADSNPQPETTTEQQPFTPDNYRESTQTIDAKVITMPRLSDTMTEGTVAKWLKKVGDEVKEGDMLAEIETDKATMEFESFNAGTLLYIGVEEGKTAPVDAILAIIGKAGTDVSSLINQPVNSVAKVEGEVTIAEQQSATSNQKPITESNNGRIFASPLAKKLAQEKGYNLAQINGTGENGRITRKDVESFTPQAAQSQVVAPKQTVNTTQNTVQPFVPAGSFYQEEIKNSQMRKTIAIRLSESIFTAPHFYLTVEISMDTAMDSRVMINNLPDTKVSFNDMVIKACAMALKKHPKVNSQWKQDAIVINHHVNIGVAVAVEDGLVVPVLPFTNEMTLTQIGANVKELATKARNKKLQPNEMEGSTFTVSNLGMFGITEFTSIINQPNSAILSVGAIIEKPVVKNGQIVVGNTMKVTLACDHRTVDGATGAQFLQTLKQYLENPVTMLA